MKGIYLYYNEINYISLSGIDRKVLWQVELFNKNSLECKLKIFNEGNEKNYFEKIFSRLPFTSAFPIWKYLPEFDKVNFIYFRRPAAITLNMLTVLKKIKKRNPAVKIILEIPTYPYDEELKTKLSNYPLLWKDKKNRKKLNGLIDRIAVQNKVDYVFGIPTLIFSNGIKVDDIQIKKCFNNEDIIEICAVATMEAWQGYERVIESLKNYYRKGGNRNIIIHFAGEGNQLSYYKNLVTKYELNNHIQFHGFLSGEKLNYVYDSSDLALDAFGRYKTKNPISTSLKSREYLAKGLPIVSGSKSDLFKGSNKYYLEFSDNSSYFDFNDIVDFYDFTYKNKEKSEVSQEIRKLAYEICDISNTMKSISNYIVE